MDVITTHTNADFDCLGAMVAAARLYPAALLAFSGSQEKGVRTFLDHHSDGLPPFTRAKDINLASITRLILVDCRQAARIGRFAEILDHPGLEIDIYDHHPLTEESIPASGGIVRPGGSSAALLTGILMERGISITPPEATVILLAIHDDAGHLLLPATTPEDYQAAGWLLGQGADLTIVSDALKPDFNRQQLAILKQLLTSLKTIPINGAIVSVAFATASEYVPNLAALAHLMRDIQNLDALICVVEMKGSVFLVARSRIPAIDVAWLMKLFGGGGHTTAASATVRDASLREVLERLEEQILLLAHTGMSAAGVMSAPVKTIPDTLTVAAALDMLTRYSCNAMPVVAGERMIGVISRKTAEKALYHGLGDSPVTDYMQTEFMRASPQTPTAEIQEYMVVRNRRFVPVFDGECLVGVVTRTDIMRLAFGGGKQEAVYDLDVMHDTSRERSVADLVKRILPQAVAGLLALLGETADELGMQIYAVGGFVRDLILGVPNLDIDVTVEGDGILFAEHFAHRHGCRVRCHSTFGTAVIVFPDGSKVDVASTRLEYYESPGVLPTVERASLRHDLYRRDFTINTLAVCLNRSEFGSLTDYYGGRQDLQERVVRVLHSLSFVEDPTRMFRAVRFEQRLGFHIAPHTESLIRSAVRMQMLDKLGGTRLFNELVQIMREKEPLAAIERISALGLLPSIHPALRLLSASQKVLLETRQVMAWFRLLFLDDPCETWQVWFLALCDGLRQNEFREASQRLAIPERMAVRLHEQRSQAHHILGAIKLRLKRAPEVANSEIYRWFNGLSLEVLLYLASRVNSEQTRRFVSLYLTKLRNTVPLLTGDNLLALGLKPGPLFRRIRDHLLQARLDGRVVTRDDELALVQTVITTN
jgi:tRNA nucleotidyltransferase (CCA-adding enzyme)